MFGSYDTASCYEHQGGPAAEEQADEGIVIAARDARAKDAAVMVEVARAHITRATVVRALGPSHSTYKARRELDGWMVACVGSELDS